MSMTVTFPGGVGVDATFKGHTVHTDQPVAAGGADEGPAPFDLFLASMATCMGYYALRFCQERHIPTEGLGLELEPVKDADRKRVGELRIELRLPAGFPEKYREAIRRAVDQCAVKKHVVEPPAFSLTVS